MLNPAQGQVMLARLIFALVAESFVGRIRLDCAREGEHAQTYRFDMIAQHRQSVGETPSMASHAPRPAAIEDAKAIRSHISRPGAAKILRPSLGARLSL